MASNLLSRIPIQTIKITPKPSSPFPHLLLPSRTLFIPSQQQTPNSTFIFFHQKLHHKPRISSLSSLHSSLSPYNPPTSKEEAILQAKTCLSTTLEKPLNNSRLFAGKFKKQKQPRFRVEIPVLDDSNESLTQLAFEFFQDLVPSKRKGIRINTLILWPNQTLTDLAEEIFSKSNSSNPVQNLSISSIATTDDYTRILNAADVAVFLVPETSQLEVIRTVSEVLYPKPVVVFNPTWGFEEENGFGELSCFVGSFEVVYSFMGLEVRGLLNKRNAVVFKCVKDGVFSGEQWVVLAEEGGGDMKVLSRFKKRPLIGEVENLLYNLMAVNSPVTKSVMFLRGLVAKVTGKK